MKVPPVDEPQSVTPSPPYFSNYPANPPPTSARLTVLPEHPCPYLPGKTAQMRGLMASRVSPALYHAFMDAGFRRSGKLIYQPVCGSCRQCQPLRLRVADFQPSKSQRRSRNRNADLQISVGEPRADDEAFALYQRYTIDWHRHDAVESLHDQRQAFKSFLYDSPMETVEFRYRDKSGKLLAVGICDVSTDALSSVYFYFDPGAGIRSLGTFGAITEIDFAARNEILYYYLGYWIETCNVMAYKARFRPYELLQSNGEWRVNSDAIATATEFGPAKDRSVD